MVRCSVCSSEVQRKRAIRQVIWMAEYWFCSRDCQEVFQRAPKPYTRWARVQGGRWMGPA